MLFKTIAIGSDHAGFEQKELLKTWLTEQGYEVIDLGCNSEESTDYPIYAKACGEAVVSGKADAGVLVCGTGIGMQIAANKVKGVRSSNVINCDFARLCREHNNTNVVTLSGRFVSLEENKEILTTFLTTEHMNEGNHKRRVAMIADIEKEQ